MKRFMNRKIISFLLALTVLLTALPLANLRASAAEGVITDSSEITAVFNLKTGLQNFPVSNIPAAVNWETEYQLFASDIPSGLKLVIVDYYIYDDPISGNSLLWYQVEAADGYVLPEKLNRYSWVFQNYVSSLGDGYDSLIIIDDGNSGGSDDEELTPGVADGTTESNITVSVAGNLPQGVTLDLKDADIYSIPGFDPELYGVSQERTIALDISMELNGEKWQPGEDNPVTVNLDASRIGLKDGDDFMVYHIHEDELGAQTVELLGPFTSANGLATFEMTKFSYVLITNTNHEINTNVVNFYPVITYMEKNEFIASGNGHISVLGIYFVENGDCHILVGALKNSVNGRINTVSVGTTVDNMITINNPPYNSRKTTITQLKLKYGASEIGVMDFTNATLNNGNKTDTIDSIYGYYDINIGGIEINKEFIFSINDSGGWGVSNIDIDLKLDYAINKTVYSVDGDSTLSGDSVVIPDDSEEVIYKIDVSNNITSEKALENATVTDFLPAGLFDLGSISVSESADGTWTDVTSFTENGFVVGDIASLLPGETKTYYVKAALASNGISSYSSVYTNTASVSGATIATLTDGADITIAEPEKAYLIIEKIVTTADPDTLPEDTFTFTVIGGDISATYELKNKESVTIEIEPGTNYTVTEINVDASKYEVKDGASRIVNAGANQAVNVTFVNDYIKNETLPASLTVTKQVVAEDGVDIPNDEFTFLLIHSGTVINTFTLKNGESITFNDLLPNVDYIVREIILPEGYVAVHESYVANIPSGRSDRFEFVNIYTPPLVVEETGSLTIKKGGAAAIDVNQTFIFDIVGTDSNTLDIDLTVTVHGNGQITVTDLPLGNYTVSERTNWSWRYTLTNASVDIEITSAEGEEITFTNTRQNVYWLDGDFYLINIFKP